MPTIITGWGAAAWTATAAALINLLGWAPRLLGALVILLVGWGIASLLGKLTDRGLDAIHFDRWMAQAHVDEALHRSGMKIEPSNLVAQLVKWLVFLVAILVASDALGLPQVTAALNSLIGYIPNVIAAVLIVAFGAVLASFMGSLVHTAPMAGARMLGDVAYWAVLVFAALAALTQLNIAPELIQTLFTAIIGAIALGSAIAFGLGLQKQAKDLITSVNVKAYCHEGDTISLPAFDGQIIKGRIESIGPMVTALSTEQGTMLVPNHLIAEQITLVQAAGQPRMTVTRMPETEAKMSSKGQNPA